MFWARPSASRASTLVGMFSVRSSSGWPTNVASMPCSRSSVSSNGRITAAFATYSRQLRNPARAPRPHLRRDVVEDRHPGSLRGGSELHVEARIVDQNEERDFASLEHRA